MTTVVRLKSPRELGAALHKLSRDMDRAGVEAMRRTARYGHSQVQRVAAQTRPRPRASGTYARAWTVVKVDDGALLANTAKHAVFVEVGRKPGKRPPLAAILRWVELKKIAKGSKAKRVALAVQRKIGKHGTKGRYILKRTIPIMQKRLRIEIDLAMQRAFAKQARVKR